MSRRASCSRSFSAPLYRYMTLAHPSWSTGAALPGRPKRSAGDPRAPAPGDRGRSLDDTGGGDPQWSWRLPQTVPWTMRDAVRVHDRPARVVSDLRFAGHMPIWDGVRRSRRVAGGAPAHQLTTWSRRCPPNCLNPRPPRAVRTACCTKTTRRALGITVPWPSLTQAV